MSKKIISNQPPKGMADWLPTEYRVRNYIFNTWRKVCLSYGFSEYLTPMLENAEIYRAKSGEDIGQKELMVFVDQGGREMALRPEMTPSVTRLVSKIYDSTPKPIKYFSIANFLRNERPQRGRNREFWQLNCDIFGSENINSDIEILTLSLDLMLAFNPPKDSFVLSLNSRYLLDGLFEILNLKNEQKISTVRIMDKYLKLPADKFIGALKDLSLSNEQIDEIIKFLTANNLDELIERLPNLKNNQGFKDLKNIFLALENLGYKKYLEFKPSVIRGFDYYDGLIFEVFDKHPENNRALFGGGRYNGLSELFGTKSFPAVGFAPGDETTKLFLESWGLLDKFMAEKSDVIFLPLLDSQLSLDVQKIAKVLRAKKFKVELGLEVTKISKALEYANKKGITKVAIFGSEEKNKSEFKIKNMATGKEEKIKVKL